MLYTLTNISLRDSVDLDPYLVAAVRAAPTAILLLPVVGWIALRAKTEKVRVRFGHRSILQYIAASLFAQFFGNAAFQKALQRIGLAASVPITLGVLIVAGAILGALWLKEPVGKNKILAMITLMIAVIILSLPQQSGQPDPPSIDATVAQSDLPTATLPTLGTDDVDAHRQQSTDVIVGSFWAALSGLAYSCLGVTMRQSLQSGTRASTLMFISGLIGVLTLAPYCVATLGVETIAATSSSQWGTMIAAGVLNLSAFIAITTALKMLPVVAVNLINSSQVAMAAIAAVILFHEPITLQLGIGISMTFVGLLILARRTRAPIIITD